MEDKAKVEQAFRWWGNPLLAETSTSGKQKYLADAFFRAVAHNIWNGAFLSHADHIHLHQFVINYSMTLQNYQCFTHRHDVLTIACATQVTHFT